MKHSSTQTVTTRHRSRRFDYAAFPEIRLSGKWLQKLGFESGKRFQLSEQSNRIVIEILKEEDEDSI